MAPCPSCRLASFIRARAVTADFSTSFMCRSKLYYDVFGSIHTVPQKRSLVWSVSRRKSSLIRLITMSYGSQHNITSKSSCNWSIRVQLIIINVKAMKLHHPFICLSLVSLKDTLTMKKQISQMTQKLKAIQMNKWWMDSPRCTGRRMLPLVQRPREARAP